MAFPLFAEESHGAQGDARRSALATMALQASERRNRMDAHIDPLPLEDEFRFHGPDETSRCDAMFYAFNTVVTLQAFANETARRRGFAQTLHACRKFERLFSRTLPHSDIARLNDAHGAWVDVSRETFELLAASKRYCEESDGVFDITMGAAVRLWDFHAGAIPNDAELAAALQHVDWRAIELEHAPAQEEDWEESAPVAHAEARAGEDEAHAGRKADSPSEDARAANGQTRENGAATACGGTNDGERSGTGQPRYRARLDDAAASVDVGGTAKGYIADALGDILLEEGVASFVVNLGGNVLTHGTKPDGKPWMIGLQDPRASRESGKVLGAVPLENASAVTSGTYERLFEKDGKTYHHILDPKTGFPAETNLAGATVIARTSLDAEGYSTTLLALGKERAAAFVQNHPAIMAAYLVDPQGRITAVARRQQP